MNLLKKLFAPKPPRQAVLRLIKRGDFYHVQAHGQALTSTVTADPDEAWRTFQRLCLVARGDIPEPPSQVVAEYKYVEPVKK